MKRYLVFLCLGLAGASQAQIIEDFEHGNAALYTNVAVGGNNFSITGASAHDGALGATFSTSGADWYYRTAVATSAGNTYAGFIRFGEVGSNGNRTYIGVGASAGGTWSMVAATNTNELILQENNGYGFLDHASAAMTYAANTWYRMELNWGLSGSMQVSLYDETRTNLLAQTSAFASGFTTSGGIAIRSFTPGGNSINSIDSIQRNQPVPEPASMAALGFGALALIRKRKRS
jgi:hypothetical protein